MSIQTTKEISRATAEELAFDKYIERNRKRIISLYKILDNKTLEDYLEEEFYSYSISD